MDFSIKKFRVGGKTLGYVRLPEPHIFCFGFNDQPVTSAWQQLPSNREMETWIMSDVLQSQGYSYLGT